MNEPAETSKPYPSLEVVRAELDVEIASLEKRTASVDTKAGLILGFSGVMVGLVKDATSGLFIAGQIVAVAAAGLAVSAFLPRHGAAINPRSLRDRYLTTPSQDVQLVILDTRLLVHSKDEEALKEKASRLRRALIVLGVAIVLIFLGTVINAIEGSSDAPGAPSRTTSSTTATPTTTTSTVSASSPAPTSPARP